MNFRAWIAWHWDWPTAIWLGWIAVFFILEWLTSGASPIRSWRGNMLTQHLRPVLLAAPLTWFIAAGIVVWLFFHFCLPVVEAWLVRAAGGG